MTLLLIRPIYLCVGHILDFNDFQNRSIKRLQFFYNQHMQFSTNQVFDEVGKVS